MQINLTKDEQHFLLDILGTALQFDIVEKMSDDWQDEDEDFRDFDSDPNVIFESLNTKLLGVSIYCIWLSMVIALLRLEQSLLVKQRSKVFLHKLTMKRMITSNGKNITSNQ